MFNILWRPTCILIAAIASLPACASVPLRQRAAFREQQYLADHRELSAEIRKAIRDGHVIVGMDREQVWTVLGNPDHKQAFSSGRSESWLYPARRLHQDQLHSHGAASFRLVFIDDRLVLIEPI